MPNLVHDIIARAALFTRSHPLALVVEKLGERIDEMIDKQSTRNKTIFGMHSSTGDDIILNNVYPFPSPKQRKWPVSMTRCRIGPFIADAMTGNSIIAPSVRPGNTYYFSKAGVKIRIRSRQVTFKYIDQSKPFRADCGHQSTNIHQVRCLSIF